MLKGGFVGLRKRFYLAFQKALGQDVGRVSTSLIWKNQNDKPQVLEMFCYQDGYKLNQSPPFFRASVNFRPPPMALEGYWSERDEIDRRGPNANIEITVMPEEAEALARWLPYWLASREGIPIELPNPPDGLFGLLGWNPKQEHVYYWSEKADRAYLSWKEQSCQKA